jgi:hypothetical protein
LSAAEVALDQPAEQVVDLHAMVSHDLGDVRVATLLLRSIRQRRTRQVASANAQNRHPSIVIPSLD